MRTERKARKLESVRTSRTRERRGPKQQNPIGGSGASPPVGEELEKKPLGRK